jgi:predicted AAA+ superfamily ATPase
MWLLGKRKAENPLSDVEGEDESEDSPSIVQVSFQHTDNPSLKMNAGSETSGVQWPPEPVLEGYVQTGKKQILDRISERSLPDKLENLSSQYEKLLHLLEQTVKTGESNSCLLIGNRGSGKSTLVRKVIQSIWQDHMDNFLVVELNGLVQTDDKSALREITRQLTRDSQMDGRTFVSFVWCIEVHATISLNIDFSP